MKSSIAKTVGAAGVALLALTGAAAAEDRQFSWSFTAGATSDYVFRGLSFNNEDPAAQGSIDMSYGILYAGVWASNISGSFGPAEVDVYAGVKPVLGPVTFDFGIIYYAYPGNNEAPGVENDYIELKAAASYSPVTNLALGVGFWYSPDQSDLGETHAIEGTAAYTFPAVGIFTPTLGGAFGQQSSEDDGVFVNDDSYLYWNIGLALAVEKFTFDFRYWDTDISQGDALVSTDGVSAYGLSDERFVFSAKVTLP